MGIREVKVYTCDGCGAQATLDRNTTARGWHTVQLDGRSVRSVLCSICYGAVEWVVKFQEITKPPKVHKGHDGKYSLRTFRERRPGAYVCTQDEGCPVESGGGGANGNTHSARCVRLNTGQASDDPFAEDEDFEEDEE